MMHIKKKSLKKLNTFKKIDDEIDNLTREILIYDKVKLRIQQISVRAGEMEKERISELEDRTI